MFLFLPSKQNGTNGTNGTTALDKKGSTVTPSNEHRLPFGKHKGKALADVPADYLAWLLSACKLSSGLRAAVAQELHRRGRDVSAVAPSPPPCVPACLRCGKAGYRVHWQEDRRGGRRVRADCAGTGCGRWLCWLPCVPPYSDEADANASTTPILDALLRLQEIGVELASDGQTVGFAGDDWRRVPPDLYAVVRQCSHQLARMLGKTPDTLAPRCDGTTP